MLKNGIHFPIAFDSKNKLFASLRKSSKEMACKLHNKIVCDHVTKFHWGMNFYRLNNIKKMHTSKFTLGYFHGENIFISITIFPWHMVKCQVTALQSVPVVLVH